MLKAFTYFLSILLVCLIISGCERTASSNNKYTISDEDHSAITSYIDKNLMGEEEGVRVYSVHEILDSDKEAGEIYIYAMIGSYLIKDRQVESLDALGAPFLLKVSKTNNKLEIKDYKMPSDGSYSKDIKRIFPKDVVDKIANVDSDKLNSEFDKKFNVIKNKNE